LIYREAATLIRGRGKADHPAFWVLRSRGHTALAQWRAAIQDLTRALELHPANAKVMMMRAGLHSRLQQWEQAEADLDQAVAAEPDDGWVRRERGLFRARRGQWEQAAADLNLVLSGMRVGPAPADVYRDLVQWEPVLQRVAELRPRDLELRLGC